MRIDIVVLILDKLRTRLYYTILLKISSHMTGTIVEKIKSKINNLYSSLSKGIHHELLVPIESILDRDTVLNFLNEVLFVISTLGLIVSLVPHAYHKCSESESFEYYKKAKELEVEVI